MRKIDVQINKAILTRFFVTNLAKNQPEICAYIDLYSGENRITEINLSSNDWDEKKKFGIPFKMFESLGKIAGELERIVALKFKSAMAELPEHISEEI